jgi:DNA-binding response OmpR family regulator
MRILVAENKKGVGVRALRGGRFIRWRAGARHGGELDFDLVVLDLNLPRLDGVAILRFLRTRKPSMPILVLTGRTRVEDGVLCLDLGADDYLGSRFPLPNCQHASEP